ncbi:MAG: glycosyltransferase [Lacunisphaera sp.]
MSAPASPIISIIVVCRNPGRRLETALGGVWAQQGMTPELVVIDGASTDGSREWLEARRSRIGALVSEPDGGIYDAMNKGIARATGDWILFLGADDRLADDTVLARSSPPCAPRMPGCWPARPASPMAGVIRRPGARRRCGVTFCTTRPRFTAARCFRSTAISTRACE